MLNLIEKQIKTRPQYTAHRVRKYRYIFSMCSVNVLHSFSRSHSVDDRRISTHFLIGSNSASASGSIPPWATWAIALTHSFVHPLTFIERMDEPTLFLISPCYRFFVCFLLVSNELHEIEWKHHIEWSVAHSCIRDEWRTKMMVVDRFAGGNRKYVYCFMALYK